MQTDDDLQTTLSKWPFILGDVLLVGTALAIGILGNWQLTNWQVASCVVSVALGAGLFVLPYIVEYRVRVCEAAEDRGAELRILRRQFASAEAELEAVNRRLRAVNLDLKELGDRIDGNNESPDLNTISVAFEAKLAPLAEAGLRQQAEIDKLHEQTSAISELIHARPDAARIERLAATLETMQKTLVRVTADLPEKGAPAKVTQSAHADGELVGGGVDDSPVEPDHKATVSRPVRSLRKRRTVEPRMLQRAIEQKQDSASAAVTRIIGGKLKEATASADAAGGKDAEPETPPKVNELDAGIANVEPEPPELADSADATGDAAGEAKEELTLPDPAADGPEPPVTPDLFAETVPPQPGKPRRTRKRDTAVIASVFIGIGNKPYLRGSGAGLSWEAGVPMEFEEIGKWRWIAPEGLEVPLELQVYRNDEDADEKGKQILEPGQQLEISPSFS